MSCNSDIILTDASDKVAAFQRIIDTAGSTPVYAFFKQEWCGHCQTLKKVFLSYRELCTEQKAKAILIMIDGETAPELFQKYDVTSFPQVMVWKNKSMIKHIVGADTASLACAMKMAGLQLTKK